MIWNQDLLRQTIKEWFEIEVYYVESQSHDLKQKFIISNLERIIWNQDLLC